MIQRLNEVFGDGKITGESLKLLAKERWAVPTTTSEAGTQASVMIRLLRLLLGKHTAAANPWTEVDESPQTNFSQR